MNLTADYDPYLDGTSYTFGAHTYTTDPSSFDTLVEEIRRIIKEFGIPITEEWIHDPPRDPYLDF